jgi:hypothetical protein
MTSSRVWWFFNSLPGIGPESRADRQVCPTGFALLPRPSQTGSRAALSRKVWSQQEIYLNFAHEFKIFYKFKDRYVSTPDLPVKEL